MSTPLVRQAIEQGAFIVRAVAIKEAQLRLEWAEYFLAEHRKRPKSHEVTSDLELKALAARYVLDVLLANEEGASA